MWPFLLTYDSLGKNIRLLFWVISLQFCLWLVVVNDLSWNFGVFFYFFGEFKVLYVTETYDQTWVLCASNAGYSKTCANLRHNQSLWWCFGSGITTLSTQAPIFCWRSSIVGWEDICIHLLLLSVISCMLDCPTQRLVLHLCAGIKLKAWMVCIHLYLLSWFCS